MAAPRSLVPDIPANQKPLRTLLQRRPPVYQTDDRLRQSQRYRGIAYIAISALENIMGGCVVKVVSPKKINKSTTAADVHPNDQKMSEVDRDHPVAKIVKKPNLNQSFTDLLRFATVQYHLTGSARFWGIPNFYDQPIEVYSLPTAFMAPEPSSPEYPHGAWRFTIPYMGMSQIFVPGYGSVTPGSSIDRRDIFDMTSYNPTSLIDGYSPLTAGSTQIDVLEAIDQSRKSAMDHGFTPDSVVTIEGATQEELDRYEADWSNSHAGADQFRKVLFTNGMGVDIGSLNINPREMDYGTGWDQMAKFGLALFGMSASIAGLAEAGSFSELYAKLLQVYSLKILPFCRMLSAMFTREIAQKYDEDCYIEITPPTIQDREFDEKQWQDDATKGSVTWNEFRARRDLPPVEGGDVLMALGAPGQQPPPGQPGADGQQPAPADGQQPDGQQPGDDQPAPDAPPPDATPGDIVESGVMSMLNMNSDDQDAQPAGFEAKSMAWDEAKHKRGNSKNKGQFSSSGGSGAGGSSNAKRAKVTSAVRTAAPAGQQASGWGPFANGKDQVGQSKRMARPTILAKPGHARVTSAIPTAKLVNGSWNDPEWVNAISRWAGAVFKPIVSLVDHFHRLDDKVDDAANAAKHSAWNSDAAYAIRKQLKIVTGGEEAARKAWDTAGKIDKFANEAADRHAPMVAQKYGKSVESTRRELAKVFADMASALASGKTKQSGVVRARIRGVGTFTLNRPGNRPASKLKPAQPKNSASAGSAPARKPFAKPSYAGRETLSALFKSGAKGRKLYAILKSLH